MTVVESKSSIVKSKPLQVGITGGIGSGKSLVCKIFSVLGAPIYNADERAKWLTSHDTAVKEKIIHEFGTEAYDSTGSLNRSYIANLVFNNAVKLNILNAIVHPAVGVDYQDWVNNQTHQYVIKEAALMFESGSYKVLDKVVNVSANEELRLQRVLQRDPFRSEDEIRNIMNKQMSEKERNSRSDYNILNDESKLLIPQIVKLDSAFGNH